MKRIGNFIIAIFSLILWVVIMLLPYCLSKKIVEYIEKNQY